MGAGETTSLYEALGENNLLLVMHKSLLLVVKTGCSISRNALLMRVHLQWF